MELGVYSFGDTAVDPATGNPVPTGQAIRNLVDAIELADQAGLDYFGVGEHHSAQMPASSPATVLAGAAGRTASIRLGSSVTVLSTDDPIRVYQQFATLDAVSGGRAEITAGRGSHTDSFPLFGYALEDYDRLYAEKLDLLVRANRDERVSWTGSVRSSLRDAVVVPRALAGHLPIWLGSGGSSGSSVRAGRLGLPIAYGIIGGDAHRFAPLAEVYRQSAAQTPGADTRVAVAGFGLIDHDAQVAKDTFYRHWSSAMGQAGRMLGGPDRAAFERTATGHGAILAGEPQEIAERIIDLHHTLGHDRHVLQMDVGHLPHSTYLRSIELLATEVAPLVRAELGDRPRPGAIDPADLMTGAGESVRVAGSSA